MRVVALFRVSTERQAAEGASLDAQERSYHEIAAREGWETVAEFRGHESATQAASDRRVLQQVLSCVRETGPDAIWVYEQSRLTRGDQLEVAMLFRELEERRLKVIIGTTVRDLASLDEQFMLSIQSCVDRAESKRIKERMLRGKREKARQGKKTGGPSPYGYTNPPPGQPNRGTLQAVPEEAAVIRRLFALAAAGRGDHAVAKDLSALGLPAPRGGRWGKSTVRRILNCPAYLGIQASGVWVAEPGTRTFRLKMTNDHAIIKEGAHEAIIDRAVWDRVHGRPRIPRTAVPRMLTGLLWVNGEQFHGDRNRGVAFYRAQRGVRGSAWLPTGDTDGRVWDAFASLATEPAFVERLMAEARNPKQEELAAQECEYLADQIARHEKRLANLLDMRVGGEIDKATYAAKAAEERAAIERLGADLANERAKVAARDGSHAPRVVRAVQTLLAGRTRLTAAQRRTVLASIVRRVDVAALPTAARQSRRAGGGYGGSGGPAWTIKSVSFRLALPPADSPTAEESRVGQLVTNPLDCMHVPATGKGHGARQLGTNTGKGKRQKPHLELATGDRARHLVTNPYHSDQVSVTVGVG